MFHNSKNWVGRIPLHSPLVTVFHFKICRLIIPSVCFLCNPPKFSYISLPTSANNQSIMARCFYHSQTYRLLHYQRPELKSSLYRPASIISYTLSLSVHRTTQITLLQAGFAGPLYCLCGQILRVFRNPLPYI